MSQKVKDAVAEQVKAMHGEGSDLFNKVVDSIVNEQLEKRADACAQCQKKWEKLQGEIAKASKPDHTIYGQDGKVLHQGFSPGAKDALEKLNAKSDKIAKAIEKCIEKGDCADTFSLAQDKSDGGGKDKGTDNS